MKRTCCIALFLASSLDSAWGLVTESIAAGRMISKAEMVSKKSVSFVQLESSNSKVHPEVVEVLPRPQTEDKVSENRAADNSSGSLSSLASNIDSNDSTSAQSNVDDEDALTKDLEKTFKNADQESKNLRLRIMLCTTVSGVLMFVLSVALVQMVSHTFWTLSPPSLFLALLGVMSSDLVTIRILSFLGAMCFLLFACGNFLISYNAWFVQRHEPQNYDDYNHGCAVDLPDAGCAVWLSFNLLIGAKNFVTGIGFATNLIPSMTVKFYDGKRAKGFRFKDSAFKVPARKALDRLWFFLRFWVLVWGLVLIVTNLVAFSLQEDAPMYANHGLLPRLVVGGLFKVLTVCFFNNNRRRHIMAFLTRMVVDQEASSAASVAALIGGIKPSDGLALAKKKFRTIPFSVLKKEDFNSNRGAKGQENKLFHETKECKLGAGDAFMSHSWSDDGPEKYKALQDWAEDFKTREGRYPNVWLDKACINQTDIESDLLCLPIFLAGCKELVLFPGPTYTSRLWCIMEVFTFLKMGGSADRITIIPVKQTEDEAKKMFRTVDVRKCQCYDDGDRQKLLGIIENCFGDYQTFNKIVHEVFTDRVSKVQTFKEKRSQRRREGLASLNSDSLTAEGEEKSQSTRQTEDFPKPDQEDKNSVVEENTRQTN